jgi:hypothetical protein
MPDSAIRAVVELAASQHSAITRRQAAELGMDRRRIATAMRQGWLGEPHPGVLQIAGSPATFERRVMSAVLAVGGVAVASHRTAARLHRLDGLQRVDDVELSTDRSHRWRHPDVIAHHVVDVPKCDIVDVDGIPTTGLARTLVDLGSVVSSRDQVGRALTDLRRRGTSLRWIRETAQRLHRPGQRGTGLALRLLDAIPCEGRVPDSWFEELLARCVDHPDIPEVIPQYRIRDARGRVVARTDLGIPEVRLGLEAHSRRFHFGPAAEPLDEQRDLAVAACGWELLYLGWHATERPAEVADIVAEVVRARRAAVDL